MPKFSKEDLGLGMNRKIDRRDFLNGMALTAGAVVASQFLPGHTVMGPGRDVPTRRFPGVAGADRGGQGGDALGARRDEV